MLSPLTPQQLANLSGRTANWIQAEIRAGRLTATVTIAGQCRRFWIDRGEVDRFVAQQNVGVRDMASRAKRKTNQREFMLGVLWSVWWLHRGHGEDTYAQELLIESVGRNGIATMQRLARAEQYSFRHGFWSELRRQANYEPVSVNAVPNPSDPPAFPQRALKDFSL